MTSSDEIIELMSQAALRELIRFARSPVSDDTFLEGYSFMLQYLNAQKQGDVFIDVLIDYSRTVKGAHLALQRLSAHHLVNEKEMPRQLNVWLVNFLMGDYQMPSSGKRGPSKTDLRFVFLAQLVLKLRLLGHLPIKPPTKGGPCVLEVIAQMQSKLLKFVPNSSSDRSQILSQIEKQRIRRMLPTSTSGLVNLYKEAIKQNPHLKISFSEF